MGRRQRWGNGVPLTRQHGRSPSVRVRSPPPRTLQGQRLWGAVNRGRYKLSAARALVQFNGHVADSVRDAAAVEQQNQLIVVIIASLLAFLAIAAIGWIISDTLVRRLWQLRSVLLAVDEGQIGARVAVVGRDEIGRVGGSVNRMLDTIVGLLDVTQRQRDALTSAAERLFPDVRVAGAGDLRASAAVGSDPIGMLANAFNFTIGRFRRFVVRTQSTVDQLDVIARQQYERSQMFLTSVQQAGYASLPSSPVSILPAGADPGRSRWAHVGALPLPEVGHARELVRQVAAEGTSAHARAVLDLAEQAYLSAGRVSQMALSAMGQRPNTYAEQVVQVQMEELRTLGRLLVRLGEEARGVQGAGTARLAELDAALDRLASSPQAVGLASVPGGASDGSLARLHSPDSLRLSIGFAQDVITLARQVMTVSQEMRTGLATFRLEGGTPQGPTLYAPGTGYTEAGRHDRAGFDPRADQHSAAGSMW